MCNACAVAEAVRLRPMVCIGDVAPGGDIHPARWASRRGISSGWRGLGEDSEKEEFDGDCDAEGVRIDTV